MAGQIGLIRQIGVIGLIGGLGGLGARELKLRGALERHGAACGGMAELHGGGVKVDEEKIDNANAQLPASAIEKGEFILHKGKKVHIRVVLK